MHARHLAASGCFDALGAPAPFGSWGTTPSASPVLSAPSELATIGGVRQRVVSTTARCPSGRTSAPDRAVRAIPTSCALGRDGAARCRHRDVDTQAQYVFGGASRRSVRTAPIYEASRCPPNRVSSPRQRRPGPPPRAAATGVVTWPPAVASATGQEDPTGCVTEPAGRRLSAVQPKVRASLRRASAADMTSSMCCRSCSMSSR